MQVVIDNRVRIAGKDLGSALAQELITRHTYSNPEWEAAKARTRWGPPKSMPRYLTTWTLDDQGVYSFPRGSWDSVEKKLTEAGLRFTVVRTKCMGDAALRDELKRKPFASSVGPRFFQVEQVQAGVDHPTCLWRAPPGSGKTTAALLYASNLQLPTLVVVPDRTLFDQWTKRCIKELGLREYEVGQIQGAVRRIRPITIAMAQTLKNCVWDYAKTFGVFIADEVQRHGAKTFSEVSDHIHAYYRLGVSADERRADGKEFLIYDLFGGVRHQVSKDLLVDTGFVLDAEIRVIPTDTEASWYKAIKGKKKATGEVQSRLQTQLALDADRNALVKTLLRWTTTAEEQTAMLAWRREHAQALQSLAVSEGYRTGLMLGGDEDRGEFRMVLEGIENGTLQCVAGTYQAIGVGFDVPRLGRGIFAAPCANNHKGGMQFQQFVGRFERPCEETGKQGAVIYYLWDRYIFGDRPLKNLKKWRNSVHVLDGSRWVGVAAYLKNGPTLDADDEPDEDDFFTGHNPTHG